MLKAVAVNVFYTQGVPAPPVSRLAPSSPVQTKRKH